MNAITKGDSVLISPNQTVSSLTVAEKFGKAHKDVLRKIDALECPAEFTERNFALAEYIDKNGETRRSFDLTRDGFSLLVMGFTGKKAMAWKIKFLEAFNQMQGQRSALAISDGCMVVSREEWARAKRDAERFTTLSGYFHRLDHQATAFRRTLMEGSDAIALSMEEWLGRDQTPMKSDGTRG